jgi:hypothetical protein
MTGKLTRDFSEVYHKIYKSSGLIITSMPIKEVESSDYGAYNLMINNLIIKFRSAKITPTKLGAFVTLWKRNDKGQIVPLDINDPFDLFIICVRDGDYFGHFVFSKDVLLQEGVVSCENNKGKRAIRVYAPWVKPISSQAIKTQKWQIKYFVDLSGSINLDLVNQLYV